MTFKDKFESERRWENRVIIISLFHNRMLLKRGKKWKLKHTAKYFCKSLSHISEDLKIAKALHEGLEFSSRKNALLIIRGSEKY